MQYAIIACDAILCVAYAVAASKKTDKTDRKWDIIISACFGLAAIFKMLGELGV